MRLRVACAPERAPVTAPLRGISKAVECGRGESRFAEPEKGVKLHIVLRDAVTIESPWMSLEAAETYLGEIAEVGDGDAVQLPWLWIEKKRMQAAYIGR
jgi:hypothetical protein